MDSQINTKRAPAVNHPFQQHYNNCVDSFFDALVHGVFSKDRYLDAVFTLRDRTGVKEYRAITV